MKTYLVGGAVRDKLLGRTVTEKDYVVIGATPEEMLQKGFKLVGKDFPVFLHPKTGEEYALARTERKVAAGYHGFTVHADKNVTLEEDLKRRDLTINAMAEDENGNIIDLFGGQKDLENKILRHVSEAFSEDPVRILRIARFASKLNGFSVAPKTHILIKKMVLSGEVNTLVPERVWQELRRALSEEAPHRFFEVLQYTGALKAIFPEIEALFRIPDKFEYHPESDVGLHTLNVLKTATWLTSDPITRFAALTHDFGKAKTPAAQLPSHRGHEETGVDLIKSFCKRLRIPNDYKDLAILVSRFHMNAHRAFELSPKGLLRLIESLDPFRRPARFEQFLTACEADEEGDNYPQGDFLRKIHQICSQVDIKALVNQYQGAVIREKIHEQRLNRIERVISKTEKL